MSILIHKYLPKVHQKMCPRCPLTFNDVKLIFEGLMSDCYVVFAINLVFREHVTLMHNHNPQELLQPMSWTHL